VYRTSVRNTTHNYARNYLNRDGLHLSPSHCTFSRCGAVQWGFSLPGVQPPMPWFLHSKLMPLMDMELCCYQSHCPEGCGLNQYSIMAGLLHFGVLWIVFNNACRTTWSNIPALLGLRIGFLTRVLYWWISGFCQLKIRRLVAPYLKIPNLFLEKSGRFRGPGLFLTRSDESHFSIFLWSMHPHGFPHVLHFTTYIQVAGHTHAQSPQMPERSAFSRYNGYIFVWNVRRDNFTSDLSNSEPLIWRSDKFYDMIQT